MSTMGDLFPLLLLAVVAVTAAAMFDCVTTDDRAVRQFPKGVWLAVILLLPGIGGVMWFAAGRTPVPAVPPHIASGHPAGRGRVEAQAAAEEPAPARRVLAPDDDPEFLARLSEQLRGGAGEPAGTGGRGGDEIRPADAREERLRRWEADLREREERLRQRGEPPIES
jgi:hypothetical protein